MTIFWFVVWLVADLIGDRAPIRFNPANIWAVTLLLTAALDLNRAQGVPRRRR
jgi:hypothetical protein